VLPDCDVGLPSWWPAGAMKTLLYIVTLLHAALHGPVASPQPNGRIFQRS